MLDMYLLNDRRTHSIHHERQEKIDYFLKLQTSFLPSTDVETIPRSNALIF